MERLLDDERSAMLPMRHHGPVLHTRERERKTRIPARVGLGDSCSGAAQLASGTMTLPNPGGRKRRFRDRTGWSRPVPARRPRPGSEAASASAGRRARAGARIAELPALPRAASAASPGRTGASHLRYSRPGEPNVSDPSRMPSTARRIAMPQVCQPLAISPFQTPSRARDGSTWNHCGSYSRANARISASLIVAGPRTRTWPVRNSSKVIRGPTGSPSRPPPAALRGRPRSRARSRHDR